jgi:hypothetical protein
MNHPQNASSRNHFRLLAFYWFILFSQCSDYPAPREETDQDGDHSENKQNVDEAAYCFSESYVAD